MNEKATIGKRRSLLVAIGLLVTLVACNAPGSGGAGDAPLAVATVAPLADLVQRVAGDRFEVKTLVPEGQDAHTFLPNPSDARVLAGVEIFFDNGYGLNQALIDFAAQNVPVDVPRIYLGEASVEVGELIPESGGSCHGGDSGDPSFHCHAEAYNAHMWPNIEYAIRYVEAIELALTQQDRDGEDVYRENAATLVAELERLSAAVTEVIATIPKENRKLVVYHDSWSYFARNYGMEVIGAIQPADFSEPSAAELRQMVEQIKEEGVPAFFGSEVFPSDVLEAVAQDSGAEYVADLADDDLPGDPGDPDHSYIGMMVSNVQIMADALGGDASALEDIDPTVGTP